MMEERWERAIYSDSYLGTPVVDVARFEALRARVDVEVASTEDRSGPLWPRTKPIKYIL